MVACGQGFLLFSLSSAKLKSFRGLLGFVEGGDFKGMVLSELSSLDLMTKVMGFGKGHGGGPRYTFHVECVELCFLFLFGLLLVLSFALDVDWPRRKERQQWWRGGCGGRGYPRGRGERGGEGLGSMKEVPWFWVKTKMKDASTFVVRCVPIWIVFLDAISVVFNSFTRVDVSSKLHLITREANQGLPSGFRKDLSVTNA
ncbi:hypothetical protein VNO78_26564 [Psophocarpus tetragonolobus]|uniref:Uncharacterized protein n=1 Tax=Psophocarpus tetragonolobus TaxID=3891 RepID=A0AAN9S0D7_PSOTE